MDSSLSDQKGKDTTSIQSLTKCVYSRGGLTGSLQPDDGHSSASKVTQQMATAPGSSFYLHISRVTQQVATALGSSYYLHMSGEHSFQARLKEPTTVLKRTLAKLCPGTQKPGSSYGSLLVLFGIRMVSKAILLRILLRCCCMGSPSSLLTSSLIQNHKIH